ncbi:DUF4238 domain-containing protein [Serinicoccus sp. CNJ-927]|uniref:DUF4238 domain-containing protein n=1 Tax=Serinicoccus sp. CNJ-927 TaxID=1904970 RepID=UPI0013012DE0|nr:DUF4238 domain-containing protein [Serinicoccus sp. CNJ-927]
MSQGDLRKAHHTVPRALLRGFADGDKVLCRRRGKRDFEQSVDRASVVRHFYSVLDDAGDRNDDVEVWLSQEIEDPFHALLPSLAAGEQPPAGSGQVIARYVAALAVRSAEAEAMQRDVTPALGGSSVLARWAAMNDVKVADLPEGRSLDLRDQAERLFHDYFGEPSKASLLRVALWVYDQAACRLKHYEWAVVTVDEDLVLADAPVVAIAHQGLGWKGLVPHGCSIFLPLAPRLLLVGTSPLFVQPRYGVTTPPRVINLLAVRDAHSTVFRHPRTPWPHDLSLAPERVVGETRMERARRDRRRTRPTGRQF